MPEDNKPDTQFNDLLMRLAQDRPFPFAYIKDAVGGREGLEIFPFGSQRKITFGKDGSYSF